MALPGGLLRLSRGLRFRLALSYFVFFTLLLILTGVGLRSKLNAIVEDQVRGALEEEWGAMKGYLDLKPYGPDWFYDPYDSEEGFIVARLQRVYLLTDKEGRPIQYSPIYKSMGFDTPEEIRAILKSGKPVVRIRYDGRTPYMIRSGPLDLKRHIFYVAIGRSLAEDRAILRRLTLDYLTWLPPMLALGALLGWAMAGRTLEPVNSVSRTARRITSSNLNTQIPKRGADDELDRLIESFNLMMGRLNRSFEQIRQFSTDVSHELRTPLTVIRGQLEVALFTARTPEQYREAMENALEDVERMSSIVRALLLLSQSETGQLLLHKSEVDLAATVRDVVDQFQIPADGRDVKLEAETPERCAIAADRIQIERLLSNLLSNALKYTGARGAVRVSLAQAPGGVRLIVEDTGQGIAAEHLPHIFERFYKAPSADPEKGLGLGLSFVEWIAKAHGGRIEVSSELNRGTRFTVWLPGGDGPAAAGVIH